MNEQIAVIGLRGIPGIMGGIETHCEKLYPLVKELDPDLDITVYCRKSYVFDRIPYKGINRISIFSTKNKNIETLLHTFLSILHARFIKNIRIVHIHAIGPGLLSPFAKLLGMKVIVTHHGADYNRQKWGPFAKFALKAGEFLCVKFASRVLIVSNSLSNKLSAVYKSDNMFFVPNGVKNIEFEPSACSIDDDVLSLINNDNSPGYILAVGRLVPEKGYHDLVEAYKKLTNKKYKLVIVGDADHPNFYSKGLIANQSDDILFLGRRSGATLDILYRKASLFILPSYHEGLPVVALEAVSYGLPILLSNIDENSDIGLNHPSYFNVGNVDELSAKLGVDNFDAYKSDYEIILDKYDWKKIAKSLVGHYEDIR
ncbi:glycosyltransferase family 4 protein [Vibrio sp. RC27]